MHLHPTAAPAAASMPRILYFLHGFCISCCCIIRMQVLGQSRSWVLRLLNYEDEVFALVSVLLERHSLFTMHATFAESLYGLKRQPVTPRTSPAAAAAAAAPGASSALGLLSRKQQYQALLCEVRNSRSSAWIFSDQMRSVIDACFAMHNSRGRWLLYCLWRSNVARSSGSCA
jgi:hypothetical protein